MPRFTVTDIDTDHGGRGRSRSSARGNLLVLGIFFISLVSYSSTYRMLGRLSSSRRRDFFAVVDDADEDVVVSDAPTRSIATTIHRRRRQHRLDVDLIANATSSAAATAADDVGRVRDDAAHGSEASARRSASPSANVTTQPSALSANDRGDDDDDDDGSENRTKARTRTTNAPRYVPLPAPNASLPAVYLGGCCGIGHRLARNIMTIVYAVGRSRPIIAHWKSDVPWSALFNDTSIVKQQKQQRGGRTAAEEGEEEEYGDPPSNWDDSPLARRGFEPAGPQGFYTAYHRYGRDAQALFEMPLARSVVRSLSESLSPLVLSFLGPMREQYERSDLHLCAHVREGNGETGDWDRKKWRHIDLVPTLEVTLASMVNFTREELLRVEGGNTRKEWEGRKVSVFVASDAPSARPWFEENAPSEWHVVRPAREVPRPETGVWFGEDTSDTNSILAGQGDALNEAMAEATADVFALGECDALFIPNFSSFSIPGIVLTRAEGKRVFFHWFRTYVEYPE